MLHSFPALVAGPSQIGELGMLKGKSLSKTIPPEARTNQTATHQLRGLRGLVRLEGCTGVSCHRARFNVPSGSRLFIQQYVHREGNLLRTEKLV